MARLKEINYTHDYIPGLEGGMLLFSWDMEQWAHVVFDKSRKYNKLGIKWYGGGTHWGAYPCSLSRADFKLWIVAGSKNCPKIPESIDYIPPNNQGREFCFWHKYTETKKTYVKEIDATFIYCPICNR